MYICINNCKYKPKSCVTHTDCMDAQLFSFEYGYNRLQVKNKVRSGCA